ncbi:MAG TPA: hypothetical protein PK989_05630, partial [Anaerolineales bacterium]|nr:hypothetical protein [Anaerolineales bacterium]
MIERSNLANADQQSGVLSDLPRRKLIEVSAEDSSLSQMRFIAFKVNHLRSLISFLRWLQLFFYFYLNILMDVLL